MTATDLLTTLRSKGLTVAADGDALTVGPRELLTDELRAAIRAHKRDLLAELPRYRWLIVEPDGTRREICTLPEMTRGELGPCYPGARLLLLPDSAAEAATILRTKQPAIH
jgi:hypothetical protein